MNLHKAILTVQLTQGLLNGARRAAQVRDTTLADVVTRALEKFVACTADEHGQSVEVFCKRTVKLKAGRPRSE
jgi:hypothetical protein